MMGLPSQSSGAYPICMVRERWPKERWSSGTIHRAERRSSYVFLSAIPNSRADRHPCIGR